MISLKRPGGIYDQVKATDATQEGNYDLRNYMARLERFELPAF
ncbi:MAG: hypothetical protein ABIE47_14100 [Pseudomonadota bacterium]